QRGLGILVHRRIARAVEPLAQEPRDGLAHRLEARVEEHGAEQRLERVGEDRRAAEAAALELALAQASALADRDAERRLRERRLVHERGAQPRQVALGKLREALVEERRDGAIEQAVAEELEPLVVRRAEAAVRERLAGELRVCEGVAQQALERGEVGGLARARLARHCFAVVTEKSRQALALPM